MIDTLRADHLGCYGYFRNTSPTIDKLAEEGVRFPNSYASSVATGPGFSSIITGLTALNHGFYLTPYDVPNAIDFDDDIPNLPEMIWDGREEVTTAAFDNLINFRSHMDQFVRGFEYYVNVTRTSDWLHHHVVGGDVNDRLLPWIESHSDEDFFLFVHYWDPHTPYNQPDEYTDLFHHERGNISDLELRRSKEGYEYVPGWGKKDQIFEGLDKPGEEAEKHPRSIDTYDEEIRYTDHLIEEVLTKLEKTQILDDTTLIVTADHGEQLGQHGMYGHGGLHEPNIHIPLILWGSGIERKSNIESYVQHVDIAPTILDLMNIDDHPPLDGQSLLPLNGASDDREKIIVETNGQRAVLEDKMKYIWHHQGEPKWNPGTEDELYDVRSDPMEINNIRDERKDKANEMRNDLKEWVEKQLEGKIDPLKYCGRGAGLTPVIERKNREK
ncbi:hypothetical protein AKJ41_04240 [candidate division MSBL1 archaeon SCGC-AAA259O05]|uniref:Sulfatase N-terminal domain-containing protein n=1 Tax=candidate division MSBL1 archaeon SCGC-AAA259O05 TaxID=1698271 RepID=A0A133V1E3_9EURY|nr:hypothetical protein AKJ41_04240 [candidate division MSBL1 archaeon SCGC-AAA259O05]